MWNDLSMEEFLRREEFSIKGAPDFPALFRKRSDIKCKKQVYSTVSKEQHQNLK